ncbi:MAG: GTPase HflX, partial [Rubrivivax sp.]
VLKVLEEIGAAQVPQILVFNKLDQLEPSRLPRLSHDEVDEGGGTRTPRVFVSARDGRGLDELRELIAQAVAASRSAPADPTPDPRFEPAH